VICINNKLIPEKALVIRGFFVVNLVDKIQTPIRKIVVINFNIATNKTIKSEL
jgi:hypothetical protein